MSNRLTTYPSGSLRELFAVSIPLILTEASHAIMTFVDRLWIAQLGNDSLNMVSVITMSAAIPLFMLISLVAISEVFVAQYYGAKQYDRMAAPVWQMIWFSLIASVVFCGAALLWKPLFIPPIYEETGTRFFQWMLVTIPLWGVNVSISAFFVGRGKLVFITALSIFINILNIILDPLFIFGWGIIPAGGVEGAMMVTILCILVQLTILLAVFLNRYHRLQFKTCQWRINIPLMWECVRVGLPIAISHGFEVLAWAVILRYFTTVGFDYITVLVTVHSIFHLLSFVTEGLSKATTAIAANLIGRKEFHLLNSLLYSSLIFVFCIAVIAAVPMVIMPDWVMSLFLKTPELAKQVKLSLILAWVYIIFDSFMWAMAGILTSGGDTRFQMVVNVASTWILCVVPVVLLMPIWHWPPFFTWVFYVIYIVVLVIIFYWRYRSGKWLKLHLAKTAPSY